MDSSGMIYLLRHCSTANDEAPYPVLLGQKTIVGLSDTGRQQAVRLARKFAGRGIAAIYASPLARTVQTARAIFKETNAAMTFCTSLIEADAGVWEGKAVDKLIYSDPDRYLAFLHDPGTHGFRGGETLSQVCRRSINFLEKLAAKHRRQRIIVVAHKYVNRTVLAHLCGVPLSRAREIDQDPGCINMIRVFRGMLELRAVNWTADLTLTEEELDQNVLQI